MEPFARSHPDDVFDGLNPEVIPASVLTKIREFTATKNLYVSAVREIATKLEVLNDEFQYTKDRNPIHSIQTRIKTPKSIAEKLLRLGMPLSVDSAVEHLGDIAGIRVICSYINDIYLIADLLTSQADIDLIRVSDYIKNPKPNGYRSLHLDVKIPVFQSTRTVMVTAEIQIRTIAMDFWASLEHELAYKLSERGTQEFASELKSCAEVIAETDKRMQTLYDLTRRANVK